MIFVSFNILNYNIKTTRKDSCGSWDLKIIDGNAYDIARKSANNFNSSLRRSNPEFFKDLQIHEIQPIKFNGSPTNLSNKLFLAQPEHAKFTNYWNALLRKK